MGPNENGEWQHVTINPKYAVHDEDKEVPVVESAEPDEAPPQKSRAGGIVSGVLLVALLATGVAGVLYHKRSIAADPEQFVTDWWNSNTTEWWKGDSPIESDTNIAPATIPKHISQPWSYHVEGSERSPGSPGECSLHGVVI